MKTRMRSPRGNGQRGIVLVEVLTSIFVFSVSVLGLLAIQGRAVQASTESKLRADAIFAANEVVGQMWVDRANLANYAGTTSMANLPSGQRVITVNGAVVTVTITWRPPGESADRRFVTTSTIVSN